MQFTKKSKTITAIVAVGLAVIALLVVVFGFLLPDYLKEQEHKRQVREYTQKKLSGYEDENLLYGDYEVDVAFLGDSLTDGYDLATYYPQYVVSNRGIGGDTTKTLEQRLQVSVYDLKPKVVVMLIGANNPHDMFDNYEDILLGLRRNLPETEIILLSLTAMGDEWGRNNQVAAYNNVKIELLAKKYGFFFVDLFTPLYDVDKGEVYEGYTVDGGHFTPLGYENVTMLVTPVIEDALQDFRDKH